MEFKYHNCGVGDAFLQPMVVGSARKRRGRGESLVFLRGSGSCYPPHGRTGGSVESSANWFAPSCAATKMDVCGLAGHADLLIWACRRVLHSDLSRVAVRPLQGIRGIPRLDYTSSPVCALFVLPQLCRIVTSSLCRLSFMDAERAKRRGNWVRDAPCQETTVNVCAAF
jgi:hypothetical protein